MALRPRRPQNPSDQLVPRGAERQQAQQDVFLREVDDALREDQMLGAARRYGVPLAIAVALALAALGGWLWWDSHRTGRTDAAGEKFVVALDQIEVGRTAPGVAALAPVIAEGGDGYSAAGRLMQAGLAAEQGRAAEAQRLYAAVAGDQAAPAAFRDLARLRDVASRFDTIPPERVIAILKPMAEPGNPWFGSAGELVGAAYLKQGRGDLAGPLFGAIAKDETVPATLRSRAQQIAGLLGVDAVVDVDKAAAVQPGAAGQP
ncbi:MAG: tetratricopeptide repeat protein [Novosphingobium sp.]